MVTPKVLSLFSGAGGLDIGFHREGYQIQACVELDQDACNTLLANAKKHLSSTTKVFCKDITEIDPKHLKSEVGNVDFMIGGPPCQSFSAAGRRAGGVYGVNDTRGSLFWYYAQLLQEFRPRGFLFENVKGILQANKKSDWELVKKSFSDLGYHLSYSIVDAAGFGVPQHRERLILVGLDAEEVFRFPRPSHGSHSGDDTGYVTPLEAFSDIDDPEEVVPQYSGKYGHLLADIPPGFNYLFYTERMGHPSPLFAWRSKFSGFLYKLDPNEPSKTLVAHQGKYDGPFHWRNRKLTIEELIRLQSFPIDYTFVGSKVSVQKQIGNAVAPNVGHALAKAVKNQLFDSNTDVDLLPPGKVLTRTLRKRVDSNRSGKERGRTVPNQLELFPEAVKWKRSNRKLRVPGRDVDARCSLQKGTLRIDACKTTGEDRGRIYLELHFHRPVADAFKIIKCELRTGDGFDFDIAWDCVHRAVQQYSSYEDLSPLYGHFTEPYPQFHLNARVDGLSEEVANFLAWTSDFANLSGNHESDELEQVFLGSNHFFQIAEMLRARRVDIRINETNRMIPKGQFRVCYPFTIPSWQPSFVKWSASGSHHTADLNISSLLNQGSE